MATGIHDRGSKKKSLKDLGFRPTTSRKSTRRRGRRHLPKAPDSRLLAGESTFERILNRFHNMQRYPPPDAPPDTSTGSRGHDDAIEKREEGFTHYLTGKWRTGYPRVKEG